MFNLGIEKKPKFFVYVLRKKKMNYMKAKQNFI